MQSTLWDRLVRKYSKSVDEDKNADFAYEKLVNSLSILSLCDNTGCALDLGCGDGRFTKELESRYKEVYAVDISEEMLKLAKLNCKTTKFIKFDLEDKFQVFNVKFDLVSCKLLLMYINDIENIARESFKVLNNRGILVISVTHPLKWITEYNSGNIKNKEYRGYLSEAIIDGKIAKDEKLDVQFKNRTFQTYVNTFTKHGFVLESVLETGVPDTFVIKYPSYLEFQKKPYRLNMKFIKK